MRALILRGWGKGLDVLTLLVFVGLIPVQRLMHRFSRLGDQAFFPPEAFPWIPALEAAAPAIRAELATVLRHLGDIPSFQEISEENRVLTDDDRWKTFFSAPGAFACPAIARAARQPAALLEQIPGLKSALFSILLPHKHLPAHRGPYAGVLRYHLGLLVPDEAKCRIRVGHQIGHWREGASLMFDDTFEHEVWNDSDSVRVVLFADILRPLPWPLHVLNLAVIGFIARSSLVRPGLAKFRDWDARLERVWNRKAGRLC